LYNGSRGILNRASVSVFVIIASDFPRAAISISVFVFVTVASEFLRAAISVFVTIASDFPRAAISVFVTVASEFLRAAISVFVTIASEFLRAAISVFVTVASEFLRAAVSVFVTVASEFLRAAVSVSVMIISSHSRLAVGFYTAFNNRSHGHFLRLRAEGRSLLRPGGAASIGTGLPFKTKRLFRVIVPALAFEGLAVAVLTLGVRFRKFSHLFAIACELLRE
jgi:hypothetical protein